MDYFISQFEIFDKGGLLFRDKFFDPPHHRGQLSPNLIIPKADDPQS
jgi:hypothetical protein